MAETHSTTVAPTVTPKFVVLTNTAGKSLPKGKTIIKNPTKRHGTMTNRRIQDLLKKPQLRRLAHRAGAKRFSSTCYPVFRGGIKQMLYVGLFKSAVVTDHVGHQRIKTRDMRYGLSHCGKPMLGFREDY